MKIITGYSIQQSSEKAVEEIKTQFGNVNIKMVIYFASSCFDQKELNQYMHKNFSNAVIFGCSTSGEIISGKMLKSSVVAMGFLHLSIEDVKVEVLENIKTKIDVESAFSSFEKHYKQKMADMDFNKYVGIILVDGLSGTEERIMERIGDLTNVTFIGGSAGDDLKFKETFVYANGKCYTNAAVLALIKPVNGFEILKTQSFIALNKNLTVTKADEQNREVFEFNNKPAILAYAESVGDVVSNADKYFMRNPVGLMIDGEPYVRSPQRIKGDSMIFYCNILEGMKLSLLESTDIVQETKEAIKTKLKEIGKVDGIINFHCILRTLELEAKDQTKAYGDIFTDVPTIGFSTYGEEYIGHINQTSTMLIFK